MTANKNGLNLLQKAHHIKTHKMWMKSQAADCANALTQEPLMILDGAKHISTFIVYVDHLS